MQEQVRRKQEEMENIPLPATQSSTTKETSPWAIIRIVLFLIITVFRIATCSMGHSSYNSYNNYNNLRYVPSVQYPLPVPAPDTVASMPEMVVKKKRPKHIKHLHDATSGK
jgi:hypothetical protein